MSKYVTRGPYHFVDFANPDSTYSMHVTDLLLQLYRVIGQSEQKHAIEVGCGEGLILDQISKRLWWKCEGHDSDPAAVDMARRLCPNIPIHLLDNPVGYNPGTDVILFCDSLEHIKEWRETLEWAMKMSEWIVIAVPDRHDPNGVRDFGPNAFDPILSEWGTCMHRATRHARHLTIWKAK